MKGLIAGSGNPVTQKRLRALAEEADLIFAADGGWKILADAGIKADLVLGDYDSLSEEDHKTMTRSGVSYQTFDWEKDFTDMEAAIRLMVQKGANSITLTGAIGTRFDHSLANIFMLKGYAEKGIRIVIEDEDNGIEVLLEGDKRSLKAQAPWYYSFLALESQGALVSLQGMKYNLDRVQVDFGSTLGVSNEVIEQMATVEVHQGCLLSIQARDPMGR